MSCTQTRRKGRRGTSPLLLLSVFLASAVIPLTAEASLPRTSLHATNSAALAVDCGQLLAAGLETPFALLAGDEFAKALTCNPAPSVESLSSAERTRFEPPQLTSHACEVSFSLHLESVNSGLNPQRGPPLEIPDLHQGWFLADPKTRIGGFRLDPEDLIGGEHHLSLGLQRGYEVGRPGLTEDEPPDPWGLAGYFFEGTWNSTKDRKLPGYTNVARLFGYYPGKRIYEEGVGTGGAVDYALGGAFGLGSDSRVADAYRRLVEIWNDPKSTDEDRKIDIFGFSRGAMEARQFAAMIYRYGIPDLSSLGSVGGKPGYTRWLAKGEQVPIRFMGLFDTVQGGYGDVAEEGMAIPPTVEAAFHAVAGDEDRTSYPVTHLQKPGASPDARRREVIFPGAHADVGGDDAIVRNELSHLSLMWMWGQATMAGVPLKSLRQSDMPRAEILAVSPDRWAKDPRIRRHVSKPFYDARYKDPIRWLDETVGSAPDPRHHLFPWSLHPYE